MALILSLDTMAQRYGVLPSQLMNSATTFDMYIMDAALSYQNYQHKKANGQVADTLSTEELQDMMKKAKAQ